MQMGMVIGVTLDVSSPALVDDVILMRGGRGLRQADIPYF